MLGILVVYVVYVSVVVPTDGVVEVVGLLEALPLSGVEHAFELLVAIVPSVGVDVAIAAYAVEIVEIDVHETVALSTVQSQFHNHLVGDEACHGVGLREQTFVEQCYHLVYVHLLWCLFPGEWSQQRRVSLSAADE